MPRKTFAVFAVFAVTACAAPTVWYMQGATDAQFRRDTYECERDSRQSFFGTGLIAIVAMIQFQDRCMRAHGYEKTQRVMSE